MENKIILAISRLFVHLSTWAQSSEFNLKNLDFKSILSVGISGFGFLLILLSFVLITREQGRNPAPNAAILNLIKKFMWINVLNIIIVGILGLPAIINNKVLKVNIASLEDTRAAVISVFSAGTRLQTAANENEAIDDIANAAESLSISLDTLAKKDPKYDSLKSLSRIINQQAKSLSDNGDSSSLKKALNDIILHKEAAEMMIEKIRI